MKSKKRLIVVTDASFKREVLFGWDTVGALRKFGYAIEHYKLECLEPENISSLSIPEHSIVLYAINKRSEKLSSCINAISCRSLTQYNVIFDCWLENDVHLDLAANISFLDLISKISVPNDFCGSENVNSESKESVVLINPQGWQKESTNLGLTLIAGALKMFGFQPVIFDLNLHNYTDEQLKDQIGRLKPLAIGYSAKTATVNEAVRLCTYLKAHFPRAKMVVGGPHVTLCGHKLLKERPVFDAGILSEGEIAAVKACLHYAAGLLPFDLRNVIYRQNNEIVENPFSPPQDINFPFWPDFDCIDGFSWEGYRYPIVTSRGCPFQCIYCCVNKLTGDRKWRSRTPQHVLAEIEYVKAKHNITQFEIWDDNFTLNLGRAKEICRLLIKKNIRLSWWCHNGIRADKIDKELARLMKKAGCTSVAFGIESGSPAVFETIKKGESLNDVVRAVKITKKAGIKTVGYFIIGLPGDNLESFVKTVEFQRKLNLHHFTFGILIPYPQTELWDIIHREGKMLLDVTQTQHFADDIVPISFELSSFPPADMTKAYYISKYYELYAYLKKQTRAVHIILELGKSAHKHLFGLLLAVPDKPNIRIECLNVKNNLSEHQYRTKRLYITSPTAKKKKSLFRERLFIFDPTDTLRPIKIQMNLYDVIRHIIKIRLLRHTIKRIILRTFNYARMLIPRTRDLCAHKLRALNFRAGELITSILFRRLKKRLKKTTHLPRPENLPIEHCTANYSQGPAISFPAMKILHVCDWYIPIGGAEKLMFDTLSALEAAGHENIMIINKHPSQTLTGKRPEYQIAHIEIDLANFRPYDYVHTHRAKNLIRKIINQYKPDVCHIHNCQNPYITKFLLKAIPCVRSIHDPRLYCFTQWRLLPDKSICPYPLGEKCMANKCLSKARSPNTYFDKIAPFVFENYILHKDMPIIILESQAQISCVLQNGYRKEQIAWLPNFTPVRAEEEVIEFNRKYYNPDENHVLFVGRASYEKGVDVILDAAPLVKTPCTIHLVTGGPYMDHINERVKKERLDNVDVVGVLSYDETRKYYAKSDIVVVPSVWIESFCLVGLEAMANRKPVIGSRTGGIKDWLVDGVTGYHFEPGNAQELASKVDYLLDNKSLAIQMGKKGYERVKTHYNKAIYVERLLGIYQRAVKYVHEVRTA
jgi:radical SAM superfamily enzyme YgiQ (UPF0313 family)/glycosyltransferase involved in cell wall biosynthesis